MKRTGRSEACLHAVMGLVLAAGMGLSPSSWAFFPTGGFRQFENTPVIARWSFENLDVNGDGEVQGPQDGVLITINTGTGGFTPAEAQAIRDGFQVWQDVPGAYIAFRFQDIQGELPVLDGDAVGIVNDPFNSVTLGDTEAIVADAFISFVVDPEIPVTNPITGQQFLVRGPQILEADIIISEAFFRPEEPIVPNQEDPITLVPRTPATIRAIMPAAVGIISGLSFTPLNNIRNEPGDTLFDVEDAVLPYRGTDGVLRMIGATPTLFNSLVLTESPDGQTLTFHGADLAYDDIAGIMHLYPRVEQLDDLFTIAQEVRGSSRPGFQSSPIVGAHVIAWADHDRNSSTGRIPLFSTMSGLYVNERPIGEVSGRFQLRGVFKRIIDENGALFSPDYVITSGPITLAPPVAFDSMHNTTPTGVRSPDSYSTAFPFEVYNEAGNLFNESNVRNGTPLYFDTVRRQIVSRNSGLTLAQQLPRNTPMFGEESDVCFLDVIGTPAGKDAGGLMGLTAIRKFRDNVMLRSRVGAAATDAYYRVAPPIAAYLLAHEPALNAGRLIFAAVVWLAMLPVLLWMALAGVIALWVGRRVIRKRLRAAATAALLVFALMPGLAHAAVTFDTPEQMVQKSDAIITGEVTAVHSYYSTDMLPATIVTDVSVAVSSSLKGSLNKGSTITIRVPGGRVGGHIVQSSAQPTFTGGEQVLLLVSSARKNIGLTLPYGKIGAMHLVENEETGETEVKAGSVAGLNYMSRIAAAVNAAAVKRGVLKSGSEPEPGAFTLESFGAFVKEAESKTAR